MPRPRKRVLGLILGAGILFFLGTNVQAGWLFVIAACLLGATVAGLVLPRRMLRGLEVARSAPERVHQRDQVAVELIVTNRSRGMRLGLLVDDGRFAPVRVAVPALRRGERAAITTRREARRRGIEEGATVVARSSAPFGVGEARRRLSADGGPTLVLPAVVPLASLPFVHPASTSDHAIHTRPRRGTGPEYLGIREYRPGDSMRHVHWPSTARTGSVMVREFEEEQTRRLVILVDAAWDAGEVWTPLDRVCSVAASVALAALGQGHGTRLVLPAGADVEILARADATELLDRLALVQPSPALPFTDLIERAGALRGIETAVLAFPARVGNDPDGLASAVAQLAERVGHVVAIPVEVMAEEAKSEALTGGAWTELEERLRGAGADVYPWRGGDDLAALLAPVEVPWSVARI